MSSADEQISIRCGGPHGLFCKIVTIIPKREKTHSCTSPWTKDSNFVRIHLPFLGQTFSDPLGQNWAFLPLCPHYSWRISNCNNVFLYPSSLSVDNENMLVPHLLFLNIFFKFSLSPYLLKKRMGWCKVPEPICGAHCRTGAFSRVQPLSCSWFGSLSPLGTRPWRPTAFWSRYLGLNSNLPHLCKQTHWTMSLHAFALPLLANGAHEAWHC